MQLKDRKILKLLTSQDSENKELGEKILNNHLTKQNVIFWYIKLEKNLIIPKADINLKFNELLGWSNEKKVLTCFSLCIEHIRNNHGSVESGAALMHFYNNYITARMTQSWSLQERQTFKENIFIHVVSTTAESI